MKKNNEYEKLPTIGRLSIQDKKKFRANHIQVTDLEKRIDSLEKKYKSLERSMIKVVAKLEQYNEAFSHMEKRISAIEVAQKQQAVRKPRTQTIPVIKPRNLNIGDSITLGRYGRNDIEWIVIDKKNQDHSYLLVSKYILFEESFNYSGSGVTWENSSLRNYLNVDFYSNCFTNDERRMIKNVLNKNANNDHYKTNGGNDTNDYIFLLSIDEVTTYFKSKEKRKTVNLEKKVGSYWLRTPGYLNLRVSCVGNDGYVVDYGDYVDYLCGVRPAMWVTIEKNL